MGNDVDVYVNDSPLQYKIELRIRNHSTLTRQSLIEAIADSVPKQLKVDLEAPEAFVLVEVFKVRHQLIWAVTGHPRSNHSEWSPLLRFSLGKLPGDRAPAA